MSLSEGQEVELAIEKPVTGGRMMARHLGQVVLVRGAIPGERVRAWIERAEKRMAYAVTRDVLEASSDRRPGNDDPLCGGALYSHITYPRQLAIKSDVIRDAFGRLAGHPIELPVDVAGSAEAGYRMRARFHVRGGRAGFYREGTHQLCGAAATRQLRGETIAAVDRLAASLERVAPGDVMSITIAENLAGDERAAHLEVGPQPRLTVEGLEHAAADAGLAGISAHSDTAAAGISAGDAAVGDPLSALTDNQVANGTLRRQAASFFQANRFLLSALVLAVAAEAPDSGELLDLYAGVGVFSVALAALGRPQLTAVEGDRTSGADLRENARAFAPRLDARIGSVEAYLAGRRRTPAAVVIDPPRTGLSKEAAASLVRLASPQVIYVSCDPPTLARDARKLIDGGYQMTSLRAFDLFPNTPHVECLAVFRK